MGGTDPIYIGLISAIISVYCASGTVGRIVYNRGIMPGGLQSIQDGPHKGV